MAKKEFSKVSKKIAGRARDGARADNPEESKKILGGFAQVVAEQYRNSVCSSYLAGATPHAPRRGPRPKGDRMSPAMCKMPPPLRRDFEKLARDCGLSVSAMLRKLAEEALGRKPEELPFAYPKFLITELRALSVEVSRQGNNINQIARHLNAHGTDESSMYARLVIQHLRRVEDAFDRMKGPR
ncbi:plasmid mobilization relaxosome protein MobC [Paludibacterium sp.]|uniref:plasmid mobilization relaxosome protein MobC n=1 Tax=Paludibacterium sp. TaxID=1917523 RepID=UPI0025DD60AB|nr:plasmid mobilization relaxosome protein MobC [Paludibacterium sp.]MBV8649609.1 plasmid mobilization relaxosome protein MobC [Paludibacterium sp.]